MQIEPKAGKNVGVGAAAAAEAVVALEHRYAQAGAGKVGRERQAVVTCADNNSVELSHGITPRQLYPVMPALVAGKWPG